MTAVTRRHFVAGAGAAVVAAGCASNGESETLLSGKPPAEAGEVELIELASNESIIPEFTPISEMPVADEGEVHVAYAPDVPPPIARSDQRVIEISLDVIEGVCPLDPANDVSTLMWGYRVTGDDDIVCGSPGPVVRGRVGDLARITMHNLAGNQHPHNIDFHAVTGQGGGAADLLANPGETKVIEARLLYPGAFMYHCAAGDVPELIAKGMYGMFIVDPAEPLPEVDHEWSIMQSEWYVGAPDEGGEAEFDREALFAEEPRYVTFNGRTDALADANALQMNVGERARFYMVNEGLNLDSNFHPIGSHWDTVYPEAATHASNRVIRGSQSTLVVAGGGTVVELIGQVPSTLILVDHALVRTFYKGAIGQVVISGDANPEIFGVGASEAGAAPPPTSEPAAVEAPTGPDQVTITDGAFDPANADDAYSPRELTVAAGTEVTWTNADAVVHTVTAGDSDGRVGTPSGLFESGDMEQGDTFSFTFDEPGTYPYYCIPHPWMTGTVIVEG
ncbi:MAG: plastocyanin/azurin family copper-binding protein [Acidimicrobiales bacterium]